MHLRACLQNQYFSTANSARPVSPDAQILALANKTKEFGSTPSARRSVWRVILKIPALTVQNHRKLLI